MSKESIPGPVDHSPFHTSWAPLGDKKEWITHTNCPAIPITKSFQIWQGFAVTNWFPFLPVSLPLDQLPTTQQAALTFTAGLARGCWGGAAPALWLQRLI